MSKEHAVEWHEPAVDAYQHRGPLHGNLLKPLGLDTPVVALQEVRQRPPDPAMVVWAEAVVVEPAARKCRPAPRRLAGLQHPAVAEGFLSVSPRGEAKVAANPVTRNSPIVAQ